MAVISTKELFDAYFATKPQDSLNKTRPQVDRSEVYEYEIKIGKQLVDMNEDELLEMILSFKNKKSATSQDNQMSLASFRKYVSTMRLIFDFYARNYEVILNPFGSSMFRGVNGDELFLDKRDRITKGDIESTIEKIHKTYSYEKACYLELIMLLFYDGFSNANEIVELKEEMIDFRKREVRLPGRIVKLSSRSVELLRMFNDIGSVSFKTGTYFMIGWHGGYFKHIVRPKESNRFQEKDVADIGRKINGLITAQIAKKFEININYRVLYLLGFYDFCVQKVGEERIKEIVTSYKVKTDHAAFEMLVSEYPVLTDSLSDLKRNLRQFV